MTTHLIHAATMPRAGLYAVTQLDPEDFFSAIEAAHAAGQLVNCIAYRGNLDLVFQMTRVDLLEEVRPLELEDGDRILIMRLKYDPRNKPDKRRIVGVQDFIYQMAIYRETVNMSKKKKTFVNQQGHAPLAGDVVGFSQDKIDDFNRRLQLLSEEPEGLPSITAFPEIKLTEKQIDVIAAPMFGWSKDQLMEYYQGKIHGQILLSSSDYVTREDQPDFQYLVDLGVKAMKAGMRLCNGDLP